MIHGHDTRLHRIVCEITNGVSPLDLVPSDFWAL